VDHSPFSLGVRVYQGQPMKIWFLGSLLIACWLGMQAVHESGHVVAAWLTGGRVEHVNLLPWTISRTDVSPNPHPLPVVWGGPLVGVSLPLAAWAIARTCRSSAAPFLRFFAGFCLVANGLYLSVGSFDGVGDAGELLHLGAPKWMLWLFGLIATPAGLAMWHRQGAWFGIGPDAKAIERPLVVRTIAVAIGLAMLGVIVSVATN
jgi:hypothetical protein